MVNERGGLVKRGSSPLVKQQLGLRAGASVFAYEYEAFVRGHTQAAFAALRFDLISQIDILFVKKSDG